MSTTNHLKRLATRNVSPIQISLKNIVIKLHPSQLEQLKNDYIKKHFISLPNFLATDALNLILGKLKKNEFVPAKEEDYHCIKVASPLDNQISRICSFLINDSRLFSFIESITGCAPIKEFGGRVIALDPHKNHFISWHCDAQTRAPKGASRIASLRINLSPNGFRGGVLQFRKEGSPKILSRYMNTVCGNAVIFRSTDSFHRNTRVLGNEPKITFSGWFYGHEK